MSTFTDIRLELTASPRSTPHIYKKYQTLIDNMFPNINRYAEKLWLISNCKMKQQLCICGKPKTFHRYSSGYFATCGDDECKLKSKNINTIDTNMKRFGFANAMSSEIVKEKVRQTLLERTGYSHNFADPVSRNRAKETMKTLYGIESPLQSKEFIAKRRQTNIERHGSISWLNSEKHKENLINKYGTDNVMLVPEIADKVSKTHIQNSFNIILDKINTYEFVNYIGHEDKKRFILKCKTCNNQFSICRCGINAYMRTSINCCPTCNFKNRFRSNGERSIFDWLNSLNTGLTITPNKKFKNWELDVYIEELKIGIEYNGVYWHNEDHKDNIYHQKKSEFFEKYGINLIHIWEDDWQLKKEILKNIIISKINSIRIGARKTIVNVIDFKTAKSFHELYHLDGFRTGSFHIGLFYNDELISCCTFGKSRYQKKYEWELIRYTTKETYSILGGFSKMLSLFEKEVNPKSLITYKKLDLGISNIYEKLGFTKIDRTKPNFFWVIDGIKHNRESFQRHKLIGIAKDESAIEFMYKQGHWRVFDSGSDVFIKMYK